VEKYKVKVYTMYNPVPTRAWSRVQGICNEEQYYKGNILQYKENSSHLTKKQKYSQLAKGFGNNRKKSYATQSETYTNPNTTGLLRINYTEIPFPNYLIGQPNNISGPYKYDVANPNNCNTKTLQDGGSLICNAYSNPCTGVIIKKTKQQLCNLTSCSDVPGQIQHLCWDPRLQTFYPRQKVTMNTSGNKWPQGYKGFASALIITPPILYVTNNDKTSIQLSWSIKICKITPITSFNLFINNILTENIPNTNTYTITINIAPNTQTIFTITSLSGANESAKSNPISLSS
jgi:hypothetical protein